MRKDLLIYVFFNFSQNPREISFKFVLLTLYFTLPLPFHLKSGKIIFLKQLYHIWYDAEQFLKKISENKENLIEPTVKDYFS